MYCLTLACTHQFYIKNPIRIYRRMLTIIRLGVLINLWEAFTPATSENRPTYLH